MRFESASSEVVASILGERASFGLLLAALTAIPLQRHSLLPGTGGRLQLSDALVILATLTALPLLWARRRELIRLPFLAFGGYWLGALLSSLNAPDPKKTVLKALGIGALGAAMVLVALHGQDRRRWQRLCDAWLAGALVVAAVTAVGIAAFFVLGRDSTLHKLSAFSYGSLPPGNYPRVSGFFGNGNMYCNYLILTGGLLLARSAAHRARWGSTVLWACVVLLSLSALFSLSTGLGGSALGVALWCWRAGAPARTWLRRILIGGGLLGAAFMALITVAAIVPPGQGDLPLFGPLGELKLEPSGRLAGWLSTTDTIRANPILGAGADELVAHITHRWATQGTKSHAANKVLHLEAHNIWLGVWAQLGVFAFLALIVLTVWLLRRLLRRGQEPESLALGVAMAAAMLYHGQFGSFEDARYLWPFLGLGIGRCLLPRADSRGLELELGSPQD